VLSPWTILAERRLTRAGFEKSVLATLTTPGFDETRSTPILPLVR